MISGTFRYRTDTGEGILYPGAFLLGNAGYCYECGHEHSHGDRCLALHIDRELFGEIAWDSSASNPRRFRVAILPAVSALASTSVSLQQMALALGLALVITAIFGRQALFDLLRQGKPWQIQTAWGTVIGLLFMGLVVMPIKRVPQFAVFHRQLIELLSRGTRGLFRLLASGERIQSARSARRDRHPYGRRYRGADGVADRAQMNREQLLCNLIIAC